MAQINMKNKKKNDDSSSIGYNRTNVAVKILCVFAAFCLWIYVMTVESPEYEQTFGNVTVELINTDSLVSDSGLMLYSGYGNMVGVTVSGKKSIVSKLSDSDIVVTADVGKITGGSGRYDCKLSVDVPAGDDIRVCRHCFNGFRKTDGEERQHKPPRRMLRRRN